MIAVNVPVNPPSFTVFLPENINTSYAAFYQFHQEVQEHFTEANFANAVYSSLIKLASGERLCITLALSIG